MEVRREISKKELWERFPTVRHLYSYLEDKKGLYLPYYEDMKNRDQAITIDYLVEVLKGAAFPIARGSIRKPPRIKKPVLKLELQEKIEKISNKKCLFLEGRLPAKEWLLEVLYSLNPKDELFTDEEEFKIGITEFPEE